MPTITCKQLGGACSKAFTAETFEEIGDMSRKHAMEMMASNDPDHLEAMQKMSKLMQNPEEMNKWFAERMAEFEALR